ncbi:hypothetical protein ACFLZK_02385 [Patescibacteria group bacterium]
MPKFLYTILFLMVTFWTLLVRHWFLVDPLPDGARDINAILIFLLLLFLALITTLSLPIYYFFHKQAPTFSNLRFLYRKSLKWSTFFSFGFVLYLGLRAFNLDTTINIFLFLVMYVLMFLQMRSTR